MILKKKRAVYILNILFIFYSYFFTFHAVKNFLLLSSPLPSTINTAFCIFYYPRIFFLPLIQKTIMGSIVSLQEETTASQQQHPTTTTTGSAAALSDRLQHSGSSSTDMVVVHLRTISTQTSPVTAPLAVAEVLVTAATPVEPPPIEPLAQHQQQHRSPSHSYVAETPLSVAAGAATTPSTVLLPTSLYPLHSSSSFGGGAVGGIAIVHRPSSMVDRGGGTSSSRTTTTTTTTTSSSWTNPNSPHPLSPNHQQQQPPLLLGSSGSAAVGALHSPFSATTPQRTFSASAPFAAASGSSSQYVSPFRLVPAPKSPSHRSSSSYNHNEASTVSTPRSSEHHQQQSQVAYPNTMLRRFSLAALAPAGSFAASSVAPSSLNASCSTSTHLLIHADANAAMSNEAAASQYQYATGGAAGAAERPPMVVPSIQVLENDVGSLRGEADLSRSTAESLSEEASIPRSTASTVGGGAGGGGIRMERHAAVQGAQGVRYFANSHSNNNHQAASDEVPEQLSFVLDAPGPLPPSSSDLQSNGGGGGIGPRRLSVGDYLSVNSVATLGNVLGSHTSPYYNPGSYYYQQQNQGTSTVAVPPAPPPIGQPFYHRHRVSFVHHAPGAQSPTGSSSVNGSMAQPSPSSAAAGAVLPLHSFPYVSGGGGGSLRGGGGGGSTASRREVSVFDDEDYPNSNNYPSSSSHHHPSAAAAQGDAPHYHHRTLGISVGVGHAPPHGGHSRASQSSFTGSYVLYGTLGMSGAAPPGDGIHSQKGVLDEDDEEVVDYGREREGGAVGGDGGAIESPPFQQQQQHQFPTQSMEAATT